MDTSSNNLGSTWERTISQANIFGPRTITGRKVATGYTPVTTPSNVMQGPEPRPIVQGPTVQPGPQPVTQKPSPKVEVKKKSTDKTKGEQNYQDQFKKEIANAYQQQIDFLTQQEQGLQGQLPTQLEQISGQFEAMKPDLQSQLQMQQEAGAQAQEGIKATTQQNLANIRRSAEEQAQRAVQQFGGVGGSSAAQAAGELIAREQLRAQGAAQMQQAQGIQNVQNQLRTIQAEYNANINKLNLEKEKALQTARNEFNRQLETIRQSKAQAGATKSSQTLAALQDFATRRRTIEDQSTALANNLTLMKEQAASQANLLRLQSSLATPEVTPVNFAALFGTGKPGETLTQSNEAAKLLQAIVNTGNLAKYGITDLGVDPVTKERLFQTTNGIIDIKGNLRTGTGQFQQQNPSFWDWAFSPATPEQPKQ